MFNKEKASESSNTGSKNPAINSFECSNKSDMFARHLDYVRTVEAENESLKTSKDELITSCKEEIFQIKSTYGSEIDALRKALDEITKEKYTTEYYNEKLLEENNNLKIKFARKIDVVNELEKKMEQSEANFNKSRKVMENYDSLCVENVEHVNEINRLREQLKIADVRRTEAVHRANTLNDEVVFLKKVNTNDSLVSRESTSMITNKTEAYYNEKFDKELHILRKELNEEFDQYKEQMEVVFNKKIEDLSSNNSKITEKCNKLFFEKKSLQSENDSLHNIITNLESKITSLTTRESRHSDILAKINQEHDNFIKDTLEENSELKKKIEDMSAKIIILTNEKIANEKEACIFRSMLKGEQSRLQLTDVSLPKRRKIDSYDNEPEITAWSKNAIKIFCDSNNDRNFIQILNDGTNATDLNEWVVKIGSSEGPEVEYSFAPRILPAGASLKVWSLGEDISEDQDNVVMNVSFPPMANIMSCSLSNDMDELEASFELKMGAPKRKILKANTSKKHGNPENCSVM